MPATELLPAEQADEGCVRLAAAKALLKLARSQDNPVSADVYLQLALTMQVSLKKICQCIWNVAIPSGLTVCAMTWMCKIGELQ